ncbi:hypothetical protein PG996_008887 [Apiospora saccharicola]|uniref:Uncharacterized protein n=1 Tax=Apiospora saccharicola TaxID=335842 RepID=A0ABR1V1T2_9PEZI
MQLSTVLSLVLAAAPATLLASPMHQVQQSQQQSQGQAAVAGQDQHEVQQQSSQEQPQAQDFVVVDKGHSVTAENQVKQSQQQPQSLQDLPFSGVWQFHDDSISAENQMKAALQLEKQREQLEKQQQKQQQQKKGRLPTILGLSRFKVKVNQTQTMIADDSSNSGKRSVNATSKSNGVKNISKRHHMDLGAYFGHKKHPNCAEQESKCKNCGE